MEGYPTIFGVIKRSTNLGYIKRWLDFIGFEYSEQNLIVFKSLNHPTKLSPVNHVIAYDIVDCFSLPQLLYSFQGNQGDIWCSMEEEIHEALPETKKLFILTLMKLFEDLELENPESWKRVDVDNIAVDENTGSYFYLL